MVRGITLEVLLNDGAVLLPECSLNLEVTHLVLNDDDVQWAIPLIDIEHVAVLDDLRRENIVTTIQPLIDDRCCTLVVRDCEFVTFRFDNMQIREYFQMCLRVIIKHCGNQQEELRQ